MEGVKDSGGLFLPYWKPPVEELMPYGNIGYLSTALTRGRGGDTDPLRLETELVNMKLTEAPVTVGLTLFFAGSGNVYFPD